MEPMTALTPWLNGEDATGTWGGARSAWVEHGVHIDLDYTADGFGRLSGRGDAPRAAYHGTVDLILTLDTEKLGLWGGGTLFVYGQNGHGADISDGLRVRMPVNNLEAPPFTELAELWLQQDLFGGVLRLKLGKQDANRDFAAPRFPGNFIHSSFGVLPSLPLPSFPAPGLGAVAYVEPAPWLSLRTGVYEGEPRVGSLGFDSALQSHGEFSVAALVLRHGLGDERPAAAEYSAGAWYHSSDITTSERSFSNDYGAFALTDVVWPIAPQQSNDPRSVQMFVRAGWAPPDRNPLTLYVGGGVTYHGLRGGNDTLGLGAGRARFTALAAAPSPAEAPSNDALPSPARPGNEAFCELFYKARLMAWFTVEPDLQLSFRPGPEGTALVGGVRVKLKL
jgi:porin